MMWSFTEAEDFEGANCERCHSDTETGTPLFVDTRWNLLKSRGFFVVIVYRSFSLETESGNGVAAV